MQNVLNLLTEFVSIPSVSVDPARRNDMERARIFLKRELEALGFAVRIGSDTNNAHPTVIASIKGAPEKPTIGIYGHYDVQPEDPVEAWTSDPFTLTQRDGKLYGRGVADNKGHVIQNLAAIAKVLKSKPHASFVCVFEGEEEGGSSHFEEQLAEYEVVCRNSTTYIPLSDVSVWFVTDTGMRARNMPQIFYGLRGIVYFELTVTTGGRDLHSGVYGNRVYNSIQVLTDIFARVKDVHTGRILIPGFYDKVRKLTEDERSQLQMLVRPDEEEKREALVSVLCSQDGLPPSLVTKVLPSLDVHGIWGGYTGPGSKTVIPYTASAKFSLRLVEYQKALEIEQLVRAYISQLIPDGVKYELALDSLADPFFTAPPHTVRETGTDAEFVKRVFGVIEQELSGVFGNKVVYNRSGGSIPAAESFQRLYGKPVALMGFTLPDDNIHAPDENFDTEMFERGVEALFRIYTKMRK